MSAVTATSVEDTYRARFAESARLYESALGVFPSGITHDARYHQPFPVYAARAEGARKWTVEGHELIDLWMGHGSLLLGHGRPEVIEAVQRQAALATHPGACHAGEVRWGQWVLDLIPSAERVRFTSSGTEATLMALRLARMFTGRTKVLKLAGHFHGWHDLLIAGSAAPTDPLETPGITAAVMDDLVVAHPNDLDAVDALLGRHRPACLILEATGGHFGGVPVRGEYLAGLRALTERHGVVLIFDEVISGFRVHPGGAQAHYGVTPDLTTLAKILAGGLPGGALAGRTDIMGLLAFDNPSGAKMFHPGTFNANPLSAAAGCAALEIVATGEPSAIANQRGARLRAGLNDLFTAEHVDWVAYGDFSGLKVRPDYHGPRPTSDDFLPFDGRWDLLEPTPDPALSRAVRCALLLNGVDLMGWKGMTSCAHTDADIDAVVAGFAGAIALLRADGVAL